jgi:methylated-DNA-[protein]-cysteine S-methyltransferase
MSTQAATERALRASAGAPAAEVDEAVAGLARRADEEGLVEVGYGSVDSPLGKMLVASTELGLVRVILPREDFDSALERLAADVSPRLLELPGRVERARRELDEYFGGERREFDLELDRRLIRGEFTDSVLKNVSAVPFGQAITYGEAASRAGSPRAYRAAGNALGSNPIPIVIPCHRVVRMGNVLGGYGGGPEMKEYLLRHEGWLD